VALVLAALEQAKHDRKEQHIAWDRENELRRDAEERLSEAQQENARLRAALCPDGSVADLAALEALAAALHQDSATVDASEDVALGPHAGAGAGGC
jgi:hypothetical protein